MYACRKISLSKEKPKLVETRNFKNYCSARFCEELSRELHNCLANHQDPNLMWDVLKNKFLKIADKHAPSKVRKVKSVYTLWFSKDIRKQVNHRDYLNKKAIQTNSPAYHCAFKRAKNNVNKIIKTAKSNYHQRNENNPKVMWKEINQHIGKKSKTTCISLLKLDDNTVVTDDENIAHTLNNYFVGVGPNLSSLLPNSNAKVSDYVVKGNKSFNFTEITYDKVYSMLLNIKKSKSPGSDKISAKFVTDAADVIAPFLTNIFNQSTSLGLFSDEWKEAVVTPIFKSDDPQYCGNYHPISVLSIIAKIFEA